MCRVGYKGLSKNLAPSEILELDTKFRSSECLKERHLMEDQVVDRMFKYIWRKYVGRMETRQKVKFILVQAMKAQREQMYSSTLSLTSALDKAGWLTPRPGLFIPGKESWYPVYRRLGGPWRRSGRGAENLAPTGIRFQDRPARSES